jgi:hypothetical protein
MSKRRIFVSAATRALGGYRRVASQWLRKRDNEVEDQAIFNRTFLEIGAKLKQRIDEVRRGHLPRQLLLRWQAIAATAR